MKYPGSFFIHEYGTARELAAAYGVSERTIFRWKARAAKESGARAKKPRRPRISTLEKFKGTRKELAAKYGVSERTAYRWLAKAKEQGADIKSRQKKAKYPGAMILNEYGTNKELAAAYDVSERTISRWKARARLETMTEPETIPETEQPANRQPAPENSFFEDAFFTEEDLSEETEYKELNQLLDDLSDTLGEFDLLVTDSVFNTFEMDKKRAYLSEYIQYQWELNPYQFYKPGEGLPESPFDLELEEIAGINIWGDEFESWLNNQIEIDNT